MLGNVMNACGGDLGSWCCTLIREVGFKRMMMRSACFHLRCDDPRCSVTPGHGQASGAFKHHTGILKRPGLLRSKAWHPDPGRVTRGGDLRASDREVPF